MYDEVNVFTELERYQIPYSFAGETEIKIKCPYHSDNAPSCNISTTKRVFKCQAGSCNAQGDIITLFAKILQQPRATILEDLSTRYNLDETKIVEPHVIEQWHDAIWEAKPFLAELYARGIDNELIKYYKLGFDGKRITIPIRNERGDFVNVRKYLPGAPGPDKMKNMRGRGSARLFPEEQMKYETVMLCGGEMKAILAARELNKHNCGAVCATQGERVLPPELLKRFTNKTAIVCFDVDGAGIKASDDNCRAFKTIAAEIFNVVLPLDLNKYPKGDINDYIARENGKLWPLIEAAELYVPVDKNDYSDTAEPAIIHLSAAANAKYAQKRVAVTAIVTAMDTAPYSVPRDIVVNCDKSQGAICSLCPVMQSVDSKFTIPIESPAILEIVSAPKRVVHEAIMSGVGIPKMCRVCSFDVETYYNAEDTRLSPQLEITNRATDQKMQPAVCIGTGLELNEPYKMVGRMFPHPQTQQATLLMSKYEPTRDALSTYTPQSLERLQVFQPKDWTPKELGEKLNEIYTDFANIVTGVFQRQKMHLTFDLSYHSPLHISLNSKEEKGWVETLVIGDSAQGKSEAISAMMRYYQLGEKVECKNATVAGLLGGLQQSGNGRWFATWGFFPRHDKRLLVLEELKGAHVDVIGRLTDMRSSGIAELPKIEKQRTLARTRLIALSNPRGDGRTIASYNYGIEAIKELIGGLEDIRRFDMCLVLSADEVDGAEINRLTANRNGAHTQYTDELCRQLILWSWTRLPNQVNIEKQICTYLLDHATKMCERYSDVIPIVDRGSMRLKLARLATALAARTFSCTDDMLGVRVRECHIDSVVQFLDDIYKAKAFGYYDFSEAIAQANKLVDPNEITAKLQALSWPYEFIDNMLRTDRIEVQDLQDWTGGDRIEANTLLGFLVRKHALKREGRAYRKTGLFIEFLRKVKQTRPFNDRPPGLEEPPKPEF